MVTDAETVEQCVFSYLPNPAASRCQHLKNGPQVIFVDIRQARKANSERNRSLCRWHRIRSTAQCLLVAHSECGKDWYFGVGHYLVLCFEVGGEEEESKCERV